jgi:hypothetical protein
MADLATVVRNTCRASGAGNDPHTFEITTTLSPEQRRALALIENITV